MSTTHGIPRQSHPLRHGHDSSHRSGRQRHIVLATMCAGMFLVQLDVTIVNVALPHIGEGLNTGLSGLQWVVDGYAVVLASLLLAGGTLGDRYGHKRLVLGGLVLFGAASVACALAPSAAALIAARALQGVGAAALLPGTLAVITRTFPDRVEQARAVGIWAGVSALALPAGPFVGGVLVTALGWRSVFWINVPIVAVAIVAAAVVVMESAERGRRPVDVGGVLTAAVALSATVFAVIQAGAQGLTAGVLVAAVVAVAALAGFVLAERRAGDDAMVPLALLRSRAFAAANTLAAAMNFVGIGTIFVSTLYLQGVQSRSPLMAAALMLPLFLPVAVLSPISGRMNSRWGPIPPMLIGFGCGVIGGANLLRLEPDSPYLTVLPSLAGIGIGMGMLAAPIVAAAMRAVPPERSGVASAANNTARQAAGALGIAVFGAIAASPDNAGRFVTGMHINGLVAAAVWGAAAVLAVTALHRPEQPS